MIKVISLKDRWRNAADLAAAVLNRRFWIASWLYEAIEKGNDMLIRDMI